MLSLIRLAALPFAFVSTPGLRSLVAATTVIVSFFAAAPAFAAPPVNDNFAAATIVTGTSARLTSSSNTVEATKEPGETNHHGNIGGHSIWWRWTAPVSASVSLDTVESSFDTVLGVYTGSAVNALNFVASNDDVTQTTLGSALAFQATAGTTYYIAVDGFTSGQGSAVGDVVLKLDAAVFSVITLAGSAGQAGSTDGLGDNARFGNPLSIAIDSSGNLHVTDLFNNIRRVDPTGLVSTVAGLYGLSGAGSGSADGTGTEARFAGPQGIAVDAAGNRFVADFGNNTIRKISPAGVVTTFAGTAGQTGSTDATGTAARFNGPSGLAIDAAGNLYVADFNNHTVRKITPVGVVTTIAGTAGQSGTNNGTGATALFNGPIGVAVDPTGNLFVSEFHSHTIRKIAPGGAVTTLAGAAGILGNTDGVGGNARFNQPYFLAADSRGNLFVPDWGSHSIRKVTPVGVVTTVAGLGGTSGTVNGTGVTARFNGPQGIAVDAGGNLYIADSINRTVRRAAPLVSPPPIVAQPAATVVTTGGNATFSVFAPGNNYTWQYSFDGGVRWFTLPASSTYLGTGSSQLTIVATTQAMNGNLYRVTVVNDLGGSITSEPALLTVNPQYQVQTLAGTAGASAEVDATGATARFNAPYAVAVEKFGNVYVADYGGHTLRKVTPAGVVTTLAGTADTSGAANGTGAAARFNAPVGIAVDAAGDTLLVGDTSNHTLRKITPLGVVTTFAGTAGAPGNTDATGAAARFSGPTGLAIDAAGNSYLADRDNQTIRKITPSGVVTTLAGTPGVSGDLDGTGIAARFANPNGVAISPVDGTLYVADSAGRTIRKVTPAGVVTTLAGSAGSIGITDGTGAAARFMSPAAVTVDATGNVFVADGITARTIRRITPTGVVTTIAGSPFSEGSADGIGSAARFNQPGGIAVDAAGVIFVADVGNHTIRRLVPLLATLSIATQPLDTEVAAGYAATFTVVAPGLTYQWQRSTDGGATWSDAPENATYSGTMTPRLTINGTTTTMSGDRFRVTIGNGLATAVTSAARTLTVGPAYTVSTLAGTAGIVGSTDGTGAAARFSSMQGLGIDTTGTLYVSGGNRIRKVTPGGVVTTLAGSGANGSDDGTGTAATFRTPSGTAADAAGNVFVADYNNQTIRKVTPAGVVTTFAGVAGSLGSIDATGTGARFRGPADIAIDTAGNLYVADQGNQTVRKITPAGVVSTHAGGVELAGSADGSGSAARFQELNGLTVDTAGNVYVSDFANNTIRKITPAGVVTTLAGTALIAGSVDGSGTAARFDGPNSIGVDAAGNSFVTDYRNHTIRKITPTGQVSTVIGLAGVSGSTEGTGVSARLNDPNGVVADAAGNLYISDSSNFTIRKAVPVYGPAAIKSALAVTGTATTPFSYAIVANGAPQSYSTTALPAGLTLNPTTGIISGTTTLTGSFAVSVTANTLGGPTTAFVVFTFNAPAAPVIATQPVDATVFSGTPAQFAVTATGATALTYKWQVQAAGGSTWTDVANNATYSGAATQTLGINATLALNGTSYQVIVTDTYGTSTTSFAKLLTVNASVAPVITTQPVGQSVVAGSSATFTAAASGTPAPTFQWKKNGVIIPGATSATLIIAAAFSSDAGLYTVEATGAGTAIGDPAILGITSAEKVIGTGTEVGTNIVHPSGNIYDQILLTGAAATIRADPGQVTRMSYIDLSNDIVQVEFSGAGSLTLVLDNPSGPAAPVNYNQAVTYMKGHAGIVLVGANDTTNVTVFSVGRINAVNQALFKDNVTYDGLADIAFFAIRSTDGKFAGARMANTSYFATRGTTGFYAPGVQFSGPVFASDISASDTAMPVFILGSGADTRITGGDLLQANAQPVKISGLTQLRFVNGSTSHGVLLPAQIIKGRLHQNGVDVTDQIAVAPVP